jgi:hypothetical protein
MSKLQKIPPAVSETVFINTTENKVGDCYNQYQVYRVFEMSQSVGIADTADSFDFISLDGYERTNTLEELKKTWPQSYPVFGLGKKDIGPCGVQQ